MTYAQTALPQSTGRQSRQTEKNSTKASICKTPANSCLSTLSTCLQVEPLLDAKQLKKRKGVHLELLGNGSPLFIGVHALPGRLPELLRFPGETAKAFCNRALHHVQGSGVVVGTLCIPPSRYSHSFTVSGYADSRKNASYQVFQMVSSKHPATGGK
jgi:hypothetical protein